MSKMAMAWVVLYVCGLIATFVNPVYGTFTYLFEYYFRPAERWWGADLPVLRYNFIISTALALSYLLLRNSMPKGGPLKMPTAKWLVGLALVMFLVTPFAVSPEASWATTLDYLKFLAFHGLIIGTLRVEWMFDGFIAIHMFGAGWWGWDAYNNPRRAAGRLVRAGSSDTRNDNFAAAHLLTVIPFIVVYLLKHPDKRLRALALVALPFVVNMFILCNSRGATLALVVATSFALLVARKGHRIRMVGVGAALAVVVFFLADPEFIARQQTTTAEGAGAGRIEIWRLGLGVVRDHPLGAGGRAFEILSPRYLPPEILAEDAEARASHNTFLLVASEWGIPGLVLFCGYYVSSFRLLREVRKRAQAGDIWYYRSVAIQCGMIGLLVSGTFSNRLYAEAPYWMGALAVALHRLQTQHLEEQAAQAALSATPPADEPTGEYVAAGSSAHRATTVGGATA